MDKHDDSSPTEQPYDAPDIESREPVGSVMTMRAISCQKC
jgi:hypothetical protein